MDERQAQLIAAAESIRGWVYTQRASWSAESQLITFPDARPSVTVPVFAHVMAADAMAADVMPAMATVAVPSVPAISPWVRIEAAATRLRAGIAQAVPPIQDSSRAAFSIIRRSWRMELVALVLLASVWTVRAYWTTWTTTVRTEFAAGREAVAVAGRDVVAPIETAVALRRSAASASALAAKRVGSLQIDSDPAGARVVIDGRDRGVTPLTIGDLAVGSHAVDLHADGGSVHRSITVSAGKTTGLKEAIFSGWLHVSSPIELQVSEGARGFKLDDRNQALVPSGPHDVVFQNQALGFREVHHIDVRPGETTSIVVEPLPSLLSITSNEPAEVKIDGEIVGQTPLLGYPARIGTRDVTLTTASSVARRITLLITTRPSTLDVDFSKP